MATQAELRLFDLLIQAVLPNGWVDAAGITAARMAVGYAEAPADHDALLAEAYAADDAVLGPQEAATVSVQDSETGESLNVVLNPDAASGDDPEPLPA